MEANDANEEKGANGEKEAKKEKKNKYNNNVFVLFLMENAEIRLNSVTISECLHSMRAYLKAVWLFS